ncbi:MAG TPA: hypothetical protein VGI39_19620 [Polyangiaceae bacterium]
MSSTRSSTTRDDVLLKRLGEQARARAEEARRIEAVLKATTSVPEKAEGVLADLQSVPGLMPADPAKGTLRRGGLAGRAGFAAGLSLAAAAGVVLWLGLKPAQDVSFGPYVVSVSGHVEVSRAAEDATFGALEARPGSVQEVIVRPRQTTRGRLAAKVVVMRGDRGEAVDVAPEVSEQGSVRFEMPGELLHDAAEVRVVIAPPARLAEATEVACSAPLGVPPTHLEDAVVVRVPVELTSEGGAFGSSRDAASEKEIVPGAR